MKVISTLAAPAATTPVTLAEFKAFIRQYSAHEDTVLTGILAGAVAEAEQYLQSALEEQERLALVIGPYVPASLELDFGPVRSIVSVKVRDPATGALQVVDPTVYELIQDVLAPARLQSWPTVLSSPDGFQVRYKAGLAQSTTSPKTKLNDSLKVAVMLLGQAVRDADPALKETALCMLNPFRRGQGV